MKKIKTKSKNELMPGTLEMLMLKTLSIEGLTSAETHPGTRPNAR